MAKVMVSLPEELLERIDAEAERRSMSRSALLARAATRELERPDPEVIRAAVARARKAWANAGPFESADLIRAERDSHL